MTSPKVDENIVKGLIAGIAGGLVASWIMNVFQRGLSKLFHEDEKSHGAQSLQTGSPQHGAGAYLQGSRQTGHEASSCGRRPSCACLGCVCLSHSPVRASTTL